MSDRTFLRGQLVECIYHHGLFFRPPQPGRVLFRWPWKRRHLFANRSDGMCWWYVVWVRAGYPALIPSTCMCDLAEAIESLDRFLNASHRNENDTWQIEAGERLLSNNLRNREYLTRNR